MSKAVLLDFDGVIVDSIDECFQVSSLAFNGIGHQVSSEEKDLFYQYRYLVQPAQNYFLLYKAIKQFINGSVQDIPETFTRLEESEDKKLLELFEFTFFRIREFLQQDEHAWLSAHRLSDYGKTLQNKKLEGYHIVTTKNKRSVELLLKHFDIDIPSIYDKEDYRIEGTKGKVIDGILKKYSYQEAIFVDDAVNHLKTVTNPQVKPYFADWGYDKDGQGFEVLKF